MPPAGRGGDTRFSCLLDGGGREQEPEESRPHGRRSGPDR